MSIEYLLLSLISPLLDPGNVIMMILGLFIGAIYLQSIKVLMPTASTGSKPK